MYRCIHEFNSTAEQSFQQLLIFFCPFSACIWDSVHTCGGWPQMRLSGCTVPILKLEVQLSINAKNKGVKLGWPQFSWSWELWQPLIKFTYRVLQYDILYAKAFSYGLLSSVPQQTKLWVLIIHTCRNCNLSLFLKGWLYCVARLCAGSQNSSYWGPGLAKER